MTAEQVKSAVRLEDIVERFGMKLTGRTGKDLFYRCPEAIHGKHDKTPSFTITPSVQLYKCFGCGSEGSAIDFVMAVDGVTTKQAIDTLAEIAGLAGSGVAERRGSNGGGASERVSAVGRTVPASAPAQPEVAVKHPPRGPIVATYTYTDEIGNPLFRVERHEPGKDGKKKDFAFSHPEDGRWIYNLDGVRRVLYRLPSVIGSDTVFVTEGEKDAQTLEALGYVATTNSGGSKSAWTEEMLECLRDKRVIIVPDQDEPGKIRGKELAVALGDIAAELQTVNVPVGKDVTEYVEAGNDASAFDVLVNEERERQRREEFENGGLASPFDIVMLAGGAGAFLEKREPGLPTGFRDYDYLTGGLYPGEVTMLAARPAMGKTSWGMQVALNCARNVGPVAVFSLEMSRRMLLTRLVCSEARVSMHEWRIGRMTSDQRAAMRAHLAAIAELPLYIDDTAGLTARNLRRRVEKFSKKRHPVLIVLDYLQLLSPEGKAENRNQDVSAMSRETKLTAREMNVPFLSLGQINRAADSRADPRPVLSDLRDSGSIEQDADLVVFLFREEMYRKTCKTCSQPLKQCFCPDSIRGKAEVIIAKHRNGETDTVLMNFQGQYTRFDNRAHPEAAA